MCTPHIPDVKLFYEIAALNNFLTKQEEAFFDVMLHALWATISKAIDISRLPEINAYLSIYICNYGPECKRIKFFLSWGLNGRMKETNLAQKGLKDVYNSMLTYINVLISKQNPRFGALTADMWTDKYRRRNYITCTYRFISEDMTLTKFTLATKEVTMKHTGETI